LHFDFARSARFIGLSCNALKLLPWVKRLVLLANLLIFGVRAFYLTSAPPRPDWTTPRNFLACPPHEVIR